MDIERLKKKKLRAKRDGNIRQLAEATNELADLYFQLGKLDEALEEYSEEIQAYEILGDKLNCAVAHRMIGEIHASLGEYESALKHQNLHLEGAREVKNEVEEQRALATLGRTHFCLAESLPEISNEKKQALANARKAYSRSILLCDRLKGIPREELMTMRARLLLNQGLVQEAQMEPNEGIHLIKSAIEICKKHKLSEDLHRAHLALGALHDRQGNADLALEHLDLAAKIDDVTMKANARLAKSELFLRNGEWISARKVLVALYLMKSLSPSIREQLEKLLRIAVTLSRGEEKLENNDENIEINNYKFHENLGDAAVAARCYDKALEYYKKMLFHAEEEKSNDGITAALVSLAQTFKDAGRCEEALPFARRELNLCNDPREECRSALFLADLLESVGSGSSEIIEIYKLALEKAEMSKDRSMEVTALREYLHYLESEKEFDKAEEIKERLNSLLEIIPDVDSEQEVLDTPDIGADIYLEELSDLEEFIGRDKDRERSSRSKPTRSGRSRYAIRKNEKGESQLHVACINGNIERVEKLLDSGHPTNVRDHCGWTPLHEAANHGFLEIAKLLIKAGADVNDPGGPSCGGITPLHDAAACGNCSIINLLIEEGADIYVLTKDGDSALDSLEEWRKRVESLSQADESEYKHLRENLSSKGVPRRKKERRKVETERASRSRNRNDLDLHNDEEGEDVEMENISAGEDYKRTIAVLRNRGGQLSSSNKSSSLQKDLAPLLDSEQILVDEWLDDDIGINLNKKKSNLGDPLSTAKRKSTSFEPAGERESKRQRISIEDGVLEPENICDDDDSRESSSVGTCDLVSEEPEKIRKRKRQASLLSSGFSKFSLSRTPSPSFVVTQKNESSGQKAEDITLQVFVEEKLFKLRLTVLEEQKIPAETIVKEVQKKFQDDTGCVPLFEILRSNGETFSPQDDIQAKLLSSGNETILNTKSKGIDIPPISDRYRRICNTGNVDVEEGTMKCLKTCENTSIFRLRSRETLDEEISPLLKSLEYQTGLQVLYLSGGSLNDFGKTLNRCLTNLSTLQELHLRSCDMDENCLSEIDKFPPQIRVLDLSYNPLYKYPETQLIRLLSPLKSLQTLNLAYCELEDLSQGAKLSDTLINIDISWNSLSQEGFKAFLKPHMLSLSASGSLGEHKSFSIPTELLSHPRFSLATLESLELSSCDLSDSDLSLILSHTTNLNRFIANGNPKLTKESAIKVLQHKPTLSYIDISGCKEINEPPDSFTNILNPEICTLISSMSSDVQQSWLNLWRGEATMQILPHNVVIFKHS